MDSFTFDFNNSDGGVEIPPVTEEGSSGEAIFNDHIIALNSLSVGDPTGGAGGGYNLPIPIGLDGYVLTADVGTNSLVWMAQSGGGDIYNGGQAGPVTIGTTNVTPVNIISGSAVNIGQVGSADQILLNGSVGFQYDNINSGIATFNLNSDYFFAEITNSGTNTVALPDASTAVGRQYIISKGFSGGSLAITTTASDDIDGLNTINLTVDNQRIKLISNGDNKWIIL